MLITLTEAVEIAREKYNKTVAKDTLKSACQGKRFSSAVKKIAKGRLQWLIEEKELDSYMPEFIPGQGAPPGNQRRKKKPPQTITH